MKFELDVIATLALAITVLLVGRALIARIDFLKRYNIPEPVVGGLIASAVGVGGIGSFFSLGTWLIAIGGALLLLVIYSTLTGGGSRNPHTAA